MKKILVLAKKFQRAIFILKRGTQPSVSKVIESSDCPQKVLLKEGQKTGNEWDDYRATIRTEFTDNPMSFLRQPTLSRTVHPNQQDIANLYLQDMRSNSFARTRLLARLHDVPIGDPYVCESFPLASPMSIQHAKYMLLLKEHLGIFVPESDLEHIVEFGGGYGNFCRLVYSLGYSKDYDIIDLPEMHSIQEHYLRHALSERVVDHKVKFYALDDISSKILNGKSLFMATFSLNETPMDVRLKVEPVLSKFDYLFLAYNSNFSGIDNLSYFDELKRKLSFDYELQIVKDEHRSAWFMFGKKIHGGPILNE
ncbi:putative sugar O-methyltransferase [Vibrio europaeus]|uniref:putative sugar O-methyltransferase n=1 Tax=Vibrio europaeus TaxID=300876 RepID=UPI00233F9293|nr:putative sugar O-methyltransferase [Vibrio europaeus]MDC5850456.1 putative sugar O-methyltransferase [Vibrio europaeus]